MKLLHNRATLRHLDRLLNRKEGRRILRGSRKSNQTPRSVTYITEIRRMPPLFAKNLQGGRSLCLLRRIFERGRSGCPLQWPKGLCMGGKPAGQVVHTALTEPDLTYSATKINCTFFCQTRWPIRVSASTKVNALASRLSYVNHSPQWEGLTSNPLSFSRRDQAITSTSK